MRRVGRPSPMRSTETEPAPLDAQASLALADALGETPETVISVHLLRRGLGRAYVVGEPTAFEAAIVQNIAFDSDEPMAFGANPEALRTLLGALPGWSSVSVPAAIAPALGSLAGAAIGRPVRYLDDVYHVANRPIPPIRHELVRLLTPADVDSLERAPAQLHPHGFRSVAELLAEGVAAAAMVDGGVVALARTAARSDCYADIGVATLPAWRGQGLATAAAALVAERVQAAGQIPVWSTGEHNLASLRVAAKLGFREVARRTYVILPPRR